MLKIRIYGGTIQYLASQIQEKLPYSVPYVNGNDSIFIGDDSFKNKVNEMLDFCFE